MFVAWNSHFSIFNLFLVVLFLVLLFKYFTFSDKTQLSPPSKNARFYASH